MIREFETRAEIQAPTKQAPIPGQSRRGSLAEAVTQTVVGYGLALATQAVVFPLAGIHDVSGRAHAGIGAAFVGISLARGYALRRLFAALEARRRVS